jgi:LPXTG-motif cell wall-anchored protein
MNRAQYIKQLCEEEMLPPPPPSMWRKSVELGAATGSTVASGLEHTGKFAGSLAHGGGHVAHSVGTAAHAAGTAADAVGDASKWVGDTAHTYPTAAGLLALGALGAGYIIKKKRQNYYGG